MPASIHPRIGIGLRASHIDALLCSSEAPTWVEIHSENWFADSGPIAQRLAEIRSRFELSLHGVGLSLGSADGLDLAHLQQLKHLIARCQPILVSEHLAWGAIHGQHSNDLLPLPYTPSVARLLAERIDQVQQLLGRQILVENLSCYCSFKESSMPEWAFVRDVVEQANCGLLLDLNNVYVNACNHGFSSDDYLSAMPWDRVGQIHLAGYEQGDGMLIDTHSRSVQPPVWEIFRAYCSHLPNHARILIEWDNDLPPLAQLLGEARTASQLLTQQMAQEYAHA